MSGRLDEEKLEILSGWGAGLAEDDREEVRAAGKAILILVEEIERLQVELWHARGDLAAHATAAPGQEPGGDEPPALSSALRARLAGRLGVGEPAAPRAEL